MSLKTKMEVFTLKMSVSSVKTETCYMLVLYFHKCVCSQDQTAYPQYSQFHVHEFTYLLKCICNPNSTVGVFCSLLWTGTCINREKFVWPNTFPGEVKPGCFSFHTVNTSLLCYNYCHISCIFLSFVVFVDGDSNCLKWLLTVVLRYCVVFPNAIKFDAPYRENKYV